MNFGIKQAANNNECQDRHIKKKKLDKWLMGIPDTPKIEYYGASASAKINSIVDQKRSRKTKEKKI